MKKAIAFLLAAVMVLGFCACQSGSGDNNEKDDENLLIADESGKDEKDSTIKSDESRENRILSDKSDSGGDGDEENLPITEKEAAGDGFSDTLEDDKAIKDETEAMELLESVFGTEDEKTGNLYSFGYIDIFKFDGKAYYAFRWSWLADGYMSALDTLFVSEDGDEIYSGNYDASECVLYKEKNYMDR